MHASAAPVKRPENPVSLFYARVVRFFIYTLIAVSSLSILAMMLLTCLDVFLRFFGYPIKGAFDIVKILGAITMAGALPYTTAVKGHVAIEYFFLKLSRRGRIVVDTLARSITTVLFLFLAWQCLLYGNSLKAVGQVTATLQWPIFWLPYVISFSCALTAMVILYNLVHPGREMIKP